MSKPDDTDKMLDELLKGKKPEEILGEEGLLKELTKRLVERALEGEMTEHLGYERHSPEGKNSGNSRNGKSTKTVKGDSGELEIDVPRDRNGAFEPKLVRKGQRRLPGFDEKVIALYARGMTTREIQGHLKDLYGVEISPTLVTNVTDSVLEDVKAWQNRTTEDYRARFGYLAYAAGAGTSFALPTPAGFFHYDDRSPAVYLADGSAYRLPPEVTRAGTAEATAMIHPFSKQDWVWMRWFLDTPQATTQVPDDPEGTAVLSELHGYYTQLRDPALRNSNWREKSEQMMPTFKAMESLIDRQRTLQLDAFVAALTGVRELLHG